ncbi:MAG: hypothetical protein GY896_05530 [Gammaproteobacteria bacterium]|nr:hypothetical protein [Gammaproteobacteria bacterium]
MKNHLVIAAIALLFLTATNAHAACTRDNISFYLSEGFTQEQITTICTMVTEPAAPPTPATPEPAASIPVAPPAGDNNKDAERYLREVIKGHDVHVEEGFLRYTARVCIPYGRFNDNTEPWPKETCQQVRHKVTLRGMRAKREWVGRSLFQPRQLYLEGQIERELVSDLDDFSSISRRQIIRNLRTEVKAIVPIKENMSPDRLLETLNKIAT